MKNIVEHLNEVSDLSITTYLKNKQNEQIDEGLKDVLSFVKSKFKQAFAYLKGIVAKFGTYFLSVDSDGKVMNAISPLTAGAAYVDGSINTKSTFVKMDKDGAKITGCKTKWDDAKKLYGPGNSISYWDSLIKENKEVSNVETIYENEMSDAKTINEVKLHTDDPEAKYNIIVDDDELKDEIKMTLMDHSLARMMIWGAPGIGKTAILMNVLDEMRKDFPDYRLITKTLSNETPDNFTLPKYVEIDGVDYATDVPKTWMPVYKPTGNKAEDAKLDAACGNGLLFIDELSRATPQVLSVILPLINEGLFNGYKLGSGWTIICASNRDEDEVSGQTSIGNALSNRFVQLHYEPTVHTWRKWADKQNFISPLLLQWLSMPESENMSGGKFYYMDPNEDSGRIADTKLMCTPRSWTNAMRRLAKYSHTGTLEGFTIFEIPDRIICRALNGCVPAQAVDAFMAFLSVISKIGNFDQAVYDVWKNAGKNLKINKKDLNKITLPLAQLICSAHSDNLPTKEEWENLCSWIVSQKSDQLASYVLDVFNNVFFSDVPAGIRVHMYTMVERTRRAKSKADLKLWENQTKAFCTRWGIKFNEIPDYMDGLKLLIKEYGASFKSAVVDAHTEALG